MKTKILNFDEMNSKALERVARALKKGAVIICPTDTISGFSCEIFNKKAESAIRRLKKRKNKKPFIYLASSVSMIKKFAYIKSEHEKVLKKIWPAPLTAVLKSKKDLSKTMAFRIPAEKKALSLIKKTGSPIVSTSVNTSGNKPLNSGEIIKNFSGKVGYILENRVKRISISTIIDLSGEKIRISRGGDFPARLLKKYFSRF